MPDLGVATASLSLWFVEAGMEVEAGERLLEILTPGATFDIVAPASGWLALQEVMTADPVLPGQVLGHIEDHIPVS